MTTTTFIADSMHQQVDWDDPARWTGGVVPNDPAVDVIVPTITYAGSGTPYSSTLNQSGSHAAGSLTISDNTLVIQGNFAVTNNVSLAAGASIQTNGTLTAASIDNNGSGGIYGSGHVTVTGQFLNKTQVGGSLVLTAGSLTNTGTLSTAGENTVVVSHGGFTNLSGSTLSGGSYQAGIDAVNAPRDFNLYLNVGGVIATDAATISLGLQGHIYSFDDVSNTYVSVQSSVHSIAAAGKLTLAASTFGWTDLTVDGLVTLTRSTLNPTQLTVDAGGVVSGAGALGGPILNNGTIIAKTLDNFTSALGNGITINGPVSGSGTAEVAPAIVNVLNGHQVFTPSRLEIGAAFSNTVAFDDGHGVLTLDDYADFTGKIRPAAATGDAVILKAVSYNSVTSYAYSGDSHQGTLAIQTAGGEIDLQFLGNFNTATFHLMAGPKILSSDPDTLEIDVGAPASTVLTPVDENSGARLITQSDLLANFVGTSPVAAGLAISSGLGTLVDNHNGTWSYTPAHDDSSSVAFSYHVNYSAGTAAETATLDIVPVAFGFDTATFPLAAFGTAQGWNSQDYNPRQLADVNGDGMADIVGFGSDGVVVSLATGGGHFGAPAVGIANFGFNPGAGGWSSEHQYPRQLADVNGDGMADIVGFAADGVEVSLATGGGHFASPVSGIQDYGYTAKGGGWVSQDQYPRLLADVNGDGMADIVGFAADGVEVSLATGGGHFASPISGIHNFAFNPGAGGWVSENQYPRLVADVNGDGMADIVGFGADGAIVSMATGGGHFASPVAGIQNFGYLANGGGWVSQDLYPRVLGDVNGDHAADIVGFGHDGVFAALSNGFHIV